MKPTWIMIKDKDDELTIVARINEGEIHRRTNEELAEIAEQDKSATYHMCRIEDTWTYPQEDEST